MTEIIRAKKEDSSWRSRRRLLSSLALAAAGRKLLATKQPTFSTAVNLVNVLANVVDKKGHLISGLHRDDFAIFEDGRLQTIRYFTSQSDLPLILGLMIDSSMSQEQVITPERSACFHFLDQVLRPNKDKMFLVQFDMAVLIKQELTSSWKDLNEALATVDTPSRKELRNQIGGGTVLYDAIVKSSQIMQNERGRKALIVMSDGVDNGSTADLTAAIDSAQKADTLIYSILFSDAGFYALGGGRDGKGVLQHMSRDSGGGYFEVTKKRSIDQIFELIQNELRNQYSLGYVSDQPPRDYEFRKLQVKSSRKDLIVQARDRYFAQP